MRMGRNSNVTIRKLIILNMRMILTGGLVQMYYRSYISQQLMLHKFTYNRGPIVQLFSRYLLHIQSNHNSGILPSNVKRYNKVEIPCAAVSLTSRYHNTWPNPYLLLLFSNPYLTFNDPYVLIIDKDC